MAAVTVTFITHWSGQKSTAADMKNGERSSQNEAPQLASETEISSEEEDGGQSEKRLGTSC